MPRSLRLLQPCEKVFPGTDLDHVRTQVTWSEGQAAVARLLWAAIACMAQRCTPNDRIIHQKWAMSLSQTVQVLDPVNDAL